MKIDTIKIGKRYRRDMGDLATLSESIKRLGLLQPIVVTKDHELIAGLRRLEACQSLGWVDIPVTVVNLKEPLIGERDENEERKPFTVSERVAIAEAILERAITEGRRRQAGFPPSGGNREAWDSHEQAASAVGMSSSGFDRARAVVKAAASDPALAPVVEAMDRGDIRIATAHRRVTEPTVSPVRQTMPGANKRTSSSAAQRLQKLADALTGYASALPNLDLRGEDVGSLLDEIDKQAAGIRRAVKTLRGRNGA